jgi:hypothetical protein
MSWRYRRRDYDWGGFAPYVSRAGRMRQAEKAKAKLVRKGAVLKILTRFLNPGLRPDSLRGRALPWVVEWQPFRLPGMS